MPAALSFRPDAKAAAQIERLLPLYSDRTALLLAALDILDAFHFPDKHPSPPHVYGYDPFVVVIPATCSDTGHEIPAGATAWRALWSDNRPGAVFSREALEADGIL